MADLSPEAIVEPISEDQPCGPDLDMEFDMDFMNFMAELEGKLPARYFSFDPSTIDFDDSFEQIDGFLDRTRDIRLLVPLAQLRILNGNLEGFVDSIVAIDALLKAHWSDVHPQSPDFLDLRNAQLATLDDAPTSVLPFQHTTLFRSRRAGPITLRRWQVANGDVSPREDEDRIDPGSIMSEIREADRDMVTGLIEQVTRGRDALAGIRTTSVSEGDFESAPTYDRLTEAMDAIIEMLQRGAGISEGGAVETTDGADDDATTGAPGVGGASGMVVAMPTGDVATREDAHDALFAAEKYYAEKEPSSPVLLLLREARASANKSFAELVREMVPGSAGGAFIAFGREPWFEVSLNEMSNRNPAPDYSGPEPETSNDSWEAAGLDDDEERVEGEPSEDNDDETTDGAASSAVTETSNDEGEVDEAAAEGEPDADTPSAEVEEAEEAPANDGWGDWSEDEESAPVAAATVTEPASTDDAPAPSPSDAPSKFVANNRAEALALMDKTLNYYRLAEPSSPVALIIEKAIEFSDKSFINVLSQVLPADGLKHRSAPHEPSEGGGENW